MTQQHHTLLMTANSSLTPAIADDDRPTLTHAVSQEPPLGSVTGVSQPLVQGCGTLCRLLSVSQTTTLGISVDSSRRFCLCDAAAHSDIVFCTLQMFLLTYLLTYLLKYAAGSVCTQLLYKTCLHGLTLNGVVQHTTFNHVHTHCSGLSEVVNHLNQTSLVCVQFTLLCHFQLLM